MSAIRSGSDAREPSVETVDKRPLKAYGLSDPLLLDDHAYALYNCTKEKNCVTHIGLLWTPC